MKVVNGTDLYLGDGATWNFLGRAEPPAAKTYVPVWSNQSGTAINWGTGTTNIGRYKLLAGNLCWVKIQVQVGGNASAYDDLPIGVTLPFAVQGSTREIFPVNFTSANGEGSGAGLAMVFPTEGTNRISRIRFPVSDTASGTPDVGDVNSANMLTNRPFNIRTGDVITISGTYEIA